MNDTNSKLIHFTHTYARIRAPGLPGD